MAAVSNSEPNEATPAQMQTEPTAQNGSMSVEGTGVQSEKAKAKAEAKAKAKAEKAAQKAANVSKHHPSDLLFLSPSSLLESLTGKCLLQAAARGQKQAAPTQPDENDPLKDKYGDAERIQSQQITKRRWTRVEALDKSLENQTVQQSMQKPIRTHFIHLCNQNIRTHLMWAVLARHWLCTSVACSRMFACRYCSEAELRQCEARASHVSLCCVSAQQLCR